MFSAVALHGAEPVPPEGFRSLFNGHDLSGWHGLNPHSVDKLEGEKRDASLKQMRDDFPNHWRVDSGELLNIGTGPYATTDAEYGDIELLIEYKTVPKADSGIYLRGLPQVQIWDINQPSLPSAPDRNPNRGSGGLFNNTLKTRGRDPLVVADKQFGEWNAFRIRQIGSRTWVWLNDKLVVDDAVMEDYQDRSQPIPAKGPIMLQTHGGEIRWRNLFVREIGADEGTKLLGETTPPEKKLPLPGDVFRVAGRTAFVIPAEKKSDGATPWVWYAPTLASYPAIEERWMFERFTKAGIAIAGIDVGESYGSPDGRKLFSALHRELTQKRGFSQRPIMLGRSRGGLMALGWAVENADKVGGFAGIYPVCNIASYPGVTQASGAFYLKPEQLAEKLTEHNPLDRLAPLAKAKVPLFAIHGDIDKVVPLEANSGEVRKRYESLGGEMQLIVPAGQGHNMWVGFFQCQELVDFVIANAK